MSKSVSLLLDDKEMSDLEQLARREQLTVQEWIQRAIREARDRRSGTFNRSKESKLEAVRRAAQYSFLLGD